MIKRLFFFVLLCMISENELLAQTNFLIKGKVQGIKSGLLYLSYSTSKDSIEIKENGSFYFKGKVVEPTSAFLFLNKGTNNRDNFVTIFIEPSVMTVSLVYNDFKNVKITGSVAQKEYEKLEKLKEPITKEFSPWERKLDSISKMYRNAKKNNADENTLDKLNDEIDSIREIALKIYNKQNAIDYKYFADHPRSYITAYNLQSYLSNLTLPKIKDYYRKFGTKVQQSAYGKRIKDFIDNKESVLVGTAAKNFSVTDINGDSILLSSYKGNKYVLLDFWASWCIPCRKESPHLKELYAKYKTKEFEIIGIASDDDTKDEWKKAVQKDGLPWRQILRKYDSDKKEERDQKGIDQMFAIDYLPAQILIDKNGIIIGRYDENGLSALDNKLKELFGN